jgi:formamidopyrimidine-DNA glycosylase
MPELPEVEVTRLSLVDRIAGARIEAVRLGKPLRWPIGYPPQSLVGCTVGALARRGKYLWMPLSLPEAPAPVMGPNVDVHNGGGLLWHLGMSGALRFDTVLPDPGPHDHVELATSRGCLRLTDPRRFGAVVWSPSLSTGAADKLLAGLGIEPLTDAFDGAVLQRGFAGRRVAIKQALLAGEVVVGVGNIYCSEALFQARIDPRLPAGRLSRPRCDRLAFAIRSILQRAVDVGGSTLRDFVDAHGMGGGFQREAQVYGRMGAPCRHCGAPIRRLIQGQRATYFCGVCQKR